MKKRFLSIVLIFAMIFSFIPNLAMQSSALAAEDDRLTPTIEDMKEYYSGEVKEYTYLEAMTLKRLGVDEGTLQGKLKLEDLSFEKDGSYKDSSSKDYAKAIMGLIASSFNPIDFEGKDYVGFLAESQTAEGYFQTKTDSGDKAEDIAYSIIALDMAGAEYDVYKAVKLLESKFTVEEEKAYVKEWSWSSNGNLEMTAISLTALSSHQDIANSDLIEKTINYIESERFNSGMYGTIDWSQEKESGKLTSKAVQALIAVGEEIPAETIKGLLDLKSGNQFKESKNSYGDYATAEVFAVLTDIHTGKSMFKEINMGIGNPDTVEIFLPQGFNDLKIGKKMQLLAKAYDANGKYNSSQFCIWSSDNTEAATIDEKGTVTGIKTGTAAISVKVKGFEDVKKSIVLNIVGVEPGTIKIKIDDDISEIEEGRKIKIFANVLDAGGETIDQADVQWKLSPEGLAKLDEEGLLTALSSGNITITASVQKNKDEILWDSADLKIVTRQEKIDKALGEVKDGIVNSEEKYEYTTAMGLKLMGVDEDHIAGKAAKYSQYFPNNNTRAKDVMMAVAIGKDPRNYNDKNYVQELIDNNFYEDTNPEWIVNAIIALDMAGADYDEGRAISSLVSKFENSSGRYYIKNTNSSPNNGLTALSLAALSKHKSVEGVETVMEGIKNHLEYIQDENALIVNCEAHSFAIQGLIASGEDIYSDRWTKEDKYGNKITLLDALLSLKAGNQFKVLPDNPYSKSGQEVFGFASLADLSTNKSMYYELENEEPKDYTIAIQWESEERTINQGETIKLEVKVFENGQPVNKEVVWESLDNTIAEVQDGNVKGLKEGQTKVRVKVRFFEDVYDEITIKVEQVIGKPAKIIIKELEDASIVKGDKFKLGATVLDANGNELKDNEIEWISSDEKVVSVDNNGNVTANGVGPVKITAKIKGTDIEDSISVTVFENEAEADNTLGKFIEAVKNYYETVYYTESQGQLDALENATLTRAGMNLDKWYANKNYEPSYDMNLQYLASKANQALIMLDIGENPASFKGRNLIEEIVQEINTADYGYGNQNYLKAVIAVDRFNEEYEEQKAAYAESIVINNILLAQTKEGGFKERGDSPVPLNTGYALKALSGHRSFNGVEGSITKAIEYLQSVQKDDGAFYTGTYVTGNNAEIISGLLSVKEDLTDGKWTKEDKNPIESLFKLWKDNGSFDNMEGESENNRGWISATQKSLYTLIDLKEAGYFDYVVRSKILSDKPEEPEKTLDVYTAIVADKGNSYEVMSNPKEVIISTKYHNAGLTALGSLQATTPLYEMTGSMVTSIYGIENKGMGGWMFTVNDKMPDTTAGNVKIEEGDRIVWFYSLKGMDGKIPTWEEITGGGTNEEEDFKIEVSAGETIINGKDAKLKYKVINLTDESIHARFTVGLYDKNTDKLINYSSTNKEFKPNEEIEIETIFLIPVNGEYYIKKNISNN